MSGTSNIAGQVITLQQAIDLTHSYQQANPTAKKAFLVDNDKIQLILNQKDCTQIRVYNGLNITTNEVNIVFVGVDNNGGDMTNGVIINKTISCPPICPSKSPLIK
jgi:hypothetical protein